VRLEPKRVKLPTVQIALERWLFPLLLLYDVLLRKFTFLYKPGFLVRICQYPRDGIYVVERYLQMPDSFLYFPSDSFNTDTHAVVLLFCLLHVCSIL